jgi:pimeloyl-ACP methyl ester carboxylesterase
MSFALDQLERLNASDPSGRFLGRLDIQRVGAFGHSLGGAEALQFCHDDSRCKASLDLDGAPWGSVVREGLAQPVMFLMSDHRGESDPEGARITSNFRSIFSRSAEGRRLQVVIRGANHYLFSDDAILKSHIVLRALRALGVLGIDGRRQLAVTVDSLHSFFDERLMGAGSARMENLPSLYPEIQAFE